ncbi:MAG: fibronectin type III domain-containing protein [Candidatus Latescibacteria bacterium]|nr:fibronectin type III domain-containing protein [Candidatus Latescibacterota bacterium]
MSRLLRFLCCLGLLLASCHDAPRTNPFDPALTPAVELSVALDDTAGTATLTWTPYQGQQPFREYRVLRNQIGLTRVDTLEHRTAVEQTSFVDTSLALDTDYEYWVSTVNTGGFAAPSEKQRARPLSLPAVMLLEPVFDSRTASASLKWTAYHGPRFKTYRVERRTAELAVQVVKEISNLVDTTYVDSLLSGNTEYSSMPWWRTGAPPRKPWIPLRPDGGLVHT